MIETNLAKQTPAQARAWSRPATAARYRRAKLRKRFKDLVEVAVDLSKMARAIESDLKEPEVVLQHLQVALAAVQAAEWAMLGVKPPSSPAAVPTEGR